MGPSSGKSLVALGLVELLSRRVSRLGFFRPVIRSVPDNDIELIRDRYQLPDDRIGHAYVADELRTLVSHSRDVADAAMSRAVSAFMELESRCDIVVIEGTDFTGASSPLEFDLNARVARHFGAPVLAVINGHGRSVAEIDERVRMSEESFLGEGDPMLGLIVNRVDAASIDLLQSELAKRADVEPPVWVLPEEPALRYPTLAELADVLGAVPVAGHAVDLTREVRRVKVAAMLVPNLLEHVEEGTLFISPGDRADIIVTAALTRLSAGVPSVAGVVLSGGLTPDERVLELVDGVGQRGRPLPLLTVETDTFDTAVAAAQVEGPIRPGNVRKIEAGLGLFESYVDVPLLEQRIQLTRSTVITPIMFQYELIDRARSAGAHIVLPEGTDDRILEAADLLVRRRVCEITLLGPEEPIRRRISQLGLALDDVPIVDPGASPLLNRFSERYRELRAHKGPLTLDRARDIVSDVSFFGTMMVHEGLVDGMVSGAVHTTAHTIRPALEFINTRPGVSIVSSVFLMLLGDRMLVYGDCAVIPDPDADQLADIAISSAGTARLFGLEPRIAMLSYSTGESGSGIDVDKVRAATERVQTLRPDLPVEGPIQYDAAIDAGVAREKLPSSEVAGHANVFVFPDLNSGNNTYKAVQRSAGAVAIGPVLQGLNKPVNDLSRGATVTDIVNTVAITAIQSGQVDV